MKRRILFITPDLRFGGTNSSLSNIYSAIKGEYEIDVFSLYNKQIGDYSFKGRVLPSGKLIYWCYSYFSDLSGIDKFGALLIKLILRISHFVKIDLRSYIQKREVMRIQKKHYYDMVIGFQEGSSTEFASLFKEVKKMAWIHCDYARYYSISGRKEEQLYSMFDRIICVSNYTSRSFTSIYPSLQSKVVSIYNLYNQERVLKLAEATIDDSRFDTSLFTVLSVGRIDKVKRFSSIPSIAKKLKDRGGIFKWYIIGNVVDDDEYCLLNKEIENKGMQDSVIYLGGKSNPYPFFAASNLFVTTSSSEACPIVFLEAQTFNLPIVSSDFGSAFEFIEQGRNGFVSSLDNIHKYISDIMNGHIANASLYSRISNEKIIKQLNSEIQCLLN